MSNYTFVVHSRARTPEIDSWLDRFAAAGEVYTEDLGRRRLVIISRDVERSLGPGVFFRGVAVATEHEAVVFGIDGWLTAPERVRATPGDHGGGYVAARWGRGRLRLDHDLFGSARLLHTSGRGYAAASDSLLVLASLRRALGDPVSGNDEVLVARKAKSSVAAQQVSPETILNEVAYVAAGRGLELSGALLRWRLTGPLMGERILGGNLDYVETVRRGATEVGRTVATLAEIDGWHPFLELSGGYDSRLVFAGIVASRRTDRYMARTVDHGERGRGDFEAGTHLSRMFNVAPFRETEPVAASPEDALAHWAATLLGVYDGYGPARTTRIYPNAFRVTGIGAELHKGNWGWKPMESLLDAATKGGVVREALGAQLAKAARSVGADPEIPDASELYYLGYRNGLHGGAGSIGVHMTAVHPVMQLRLAALGHMTSDGSLRSRSSRFRGSPEGIADHTVLLSPEVAVQPYDLAERNLSRAYVEERLAALGGTLPKPTPYRVYGHPDDIVDGPAELALAIARHAGFTGVITADGVMTRAPSALDLLADPVTRSAYEDVLANARWRLERHGGMLAAAVEAPPRLTMLEILKLGAR